MANSRIKAGFWLVALAAQLSGCKTEEFYFQEPEKRIHGTWKVVKVTRNGDDITERVGSGLELSFQEKGASYSINSEALPFVVAKKGTWSFDDPTYPFAISFHPEGSASAVETPFLFPITGGKRMIQFIFSPGCTENSYEYLLEETVVNNQ